MSIEGQGHFFTIYFQVLYVLYFTRPRHQVSVYRTTGPLVYFLFYRFFSQQVSVGGRNKNKNKIHSDHFPIELKSKETTVFPSILIQLEIGPNEFYFTN